MFTAYDEAVLNALYNKAIHMCKDINSSVLILVKLMEKKIIGLRIELIKLKVLFSVNFFCY